MVGGKSGVRLAIALEGSIVKDAYRIWNLSATLTTQVCRYFSGHRYFKAVFCLHCILNFNLLHSTLDKIRL